MEPEGEGELDWNTAEGLRGGPARNTDEKLGGGPDQEGSVIGGLWGDWSSRKTPTMHMDRWLLVKGRSNDFELLELVSDPSRQGKRKSSDREAQRE